MAAFTFGNVHGAYKPGVVKLRPELLDEIQTTVALAIKAGEMPDPAHSLDVAPGKPFAWCSTAVPAPRRRRSRRP